MAAAAAAFGAGSAGLGAITNIIDTFGGQAQQHQYTQQDISQTYQLQGKQNQADYERAANSYGSYGLPSWLAFSPGALNLFPRVSQSTGGQNYISSAIPGNPTSVYSGRPSQAATGFYKVPRK